MSMSFPALPYIWPFSQSFELRCRDTWAEYLGEGHGRYTAYLIVFHASLQMIIALTTIDDIESITTLDGITPAIPVQCICALLTKDEICSSAGLDPVSTVSSVDSVLSFATYVQAGARYRYCSGGGKRHCNRCHSDSLSITEYDIIVSQAIQYICTITPNDTVASICPVDSVLKIRTAQRCAAVAVLVYEIILFIQQAKHQKVNHASRTASWLHPWHIVY